MTPRHEFLPDDRVYSTGARSHIIEAVRYHGHDYQFARTWCNRETNEWWYPDRSLSLPLCRVCEKATQ